MPRHGRSDADLWKEVLSLFDSETGGPLFIRATQYASPRGIRVMDDWVWEKYLRQRKGLTIMPRGAKTPSSTPAQVTSQFKGFVTFDLTEDQFSEFDASFPKKFPLPAHFDEVLGDCKITLTPKEGNFNACAFPQTGTNAGYALSAFSNSPFEAMALCMWKFYILRSQDWGKLSKRADRKRG